jgi:hypothetical protein
MPHAHDGSSHIKRHRFNRTVRLRHAPSRPYSVVFRYADRTSATLPGNGSSSFLRFSPDGAPGISPFAGLIPQAGDQASLPDRAHVSLRASRPPRLIFVGVTGRRWREIGRRPIADLVVGVALDFWASLPSAVRIPNKLAGDGSCLGLCLLQGCRARCCAFDRARPRSDHQPPPAHARCFMRPRTD